MITIANSEYATKIGSRERYTLLGINILTYGIYGILGGSFGVVLETLKTYFNLETNHIATGLSLQAIGGCISAFLATITLDVWNRQIQFCFVTLFLAIITIGFPFTFIFWTFLVCNILIGFFCTLIDCISNAWVVELFRPHEHIFLQILHFFYSFGTIISPYLFGPYLAKKVENANETETTTVAPNDLPNNPLPAPEASALFANGFNISLPASFSFISTYVGGAQVWMPFVFLGFMIFSSSLMHWVAFALKPYKELERLRKNTNNSLNVSNQDLNNNVSVGKSSNNLIHAHELDQRGKNLSQKYYIFFVVMIVIIVTFEVANEVSAITYLPTVLTTTSELGLDNEQAGYVFSILQFAIAGARFANIFLSFRVNTVVNLYFNFVSMLVGTVMLMIFLRRSLLMVEFSIALLGLGYSSSYPLIITFVEQRISLTNRVSSIMAFSSVFGLSITPFIVGGAIEANPNYFAYITFGFIVITVAFFSVLYAMEFLRLRKT